MWYDKWGDIMGKTSSAVKARWNSKNYDRIGLYVPKGQREVIQQFAASHGETVNGLLKRLIAEAMQKEESNFLLEERKT